MFKKKKTARDKVRSAFSSEKVQTEASTSGLQTPKERKDTEILIPVDLREGDSASKQQPPSFPPLFLQAEDVNLNGEFSMTLLFMIK